MKTTNSSSSQYTVSDDPWSQAVSKIRPDAEKTVHDYLERNKDCGLRPDEILAGLSVAISTELEEYYVKEF